MKFAQSFFWRQTARLLVLAMLVLCGAPLSAYAGTTIPAGTPITVKLNQVLTSGTLSVGSSISGETTAPVMVKGVEVIPAGSAVIGRITNSVKANLAGIPGEIHISFQSVTAPDGTVIPLERGLAMAKGEDRMILSIGIGVFCCILGFLIKGDEATMSSATTVQCYTTHEVTLD